MFKGNKKYYVFLAACIIGLIILQVNAPKPIRWSYTYSAKDKMPFGTKAFYESLTRLFLNKKIETEKIPAYNVINNNKELTGLNYIIINESFYPDEYDTEELLEFVNKGNTVFIAAANFNGDFADTLHLETDLKKYITKDTTIQSAKENEEKVIYDYVNNMFIPHDTIKANFVNPQLKNKNYYSFYKGLSNTFFTSVDTQKSTILGVNDNGMPNFIKTKFGKGNFYLHTLPEVFTNYHFVNKTNMDYACKAISYLPAQNIIWDEYYKIGNIEKQNIFHVLFENEALKKAYYIALITLMLFIIIGIKRKQRTIPIIEPMKNTSIEFIEVVGSLYYQNKNHKNIAEKKINYFLDYIRNTFQVKTNIYDDIFINRISELSGIEHNKIHTLFYYFDDISHKEHIKEEELLKLNQLIDEFHKLNKR